MIQQPWENHNWKRHMYPNVHSSTITTASTWKQPRYPLTDEWIKKLWYIYTVKYYSAIKTEQIWVISSKVNEPIAYYTEWGMSERERQISHINIYKWNLEKWYRWPYLQSRNGDADTENRLVDTAGGREDGMNWERSIDMYTQPCVK